MMTPLTRRSHMTQDRSTLTIGIPSYNEGAGIVATLQSLGCGLAELGREDAVILLSDSSESSATQRAAEAWARERSACLVVHHSDRRRSLKEALNVILEHTTTDLLICVTADVVVPSTSLSALLGHLLDPDGCDVAIGTVLPDRKGRGVAGRAGTWQLRAVRRLARRLPATAVRAEGAFWGSWQTFYSSFRYTIGSGSLADDVQLAHFLAANPFRVRNATDAVVLKVPPSSLHDFALTAIRWAAAEPNRPSTLASLPVAVLEACADPIGAACYLVARAYTASRRRALLPSVDTEYWEVACTTKR